jgi:hypothetical protein
MRQEVRMNKPLDLGSLVVAATTLCLFVAALFAKGLSHDLFLEAGVFLVSVKIIIMTYRSSVLIGRLDRKLDVILDRLSKADSVNEDAEDRSRKPGSPTRGKP